MFNSSSDKAAESKRPQPDCDNHDGSNEEPQSDYYYDDATGYEVYKEDEEDEEDEVQNREL